MVLKATDVVSKQEGLPQAQEDISDPETTAALEPKPEPEEPALVQEQAEIKQQEEPSTENIVKTEEIVTPENTPPKETTKEITRKPPVSREKALALIKNYNRENFLLIYREGKPMVFFQDLKADGYPDYFCFFIETKDSAFANMELLSSIGRIYKKEVESFSITAACFPQTEGELEEPRFFPLGEWLSIRKIDTFALKGETSGPLGIEILFLAIDGGEKVYLFFDESYNMESLFFHDYPRLIFLHQDLEDNGITDIIVSSQSFEEGTGYETFLTWYKWNGKKYAEYKTANIVRNLNNFLSTSAKILCDGRWDTFLLNIFPTQKNPSRVKEESLFKQAFKPFSMIRYPEKKGPEMPFSFSNPPKEVFFPTFLESPFNLHNGLPSNVPIITRFVTSEMDEYIYTVTIMLNKNPFDVRQFSFVMPLD